MEYQCIKETEITNVVTEEKIMLQVGDLIKVSEQSTGTKINYEIVSYNEKALKENWYTTKNWIDASFAKNNELRDEKLNKSTLLKKEFSEEKKTKSNHQIRLVFFLIAAIIIAIAWYKTERKF